MDARSDTQGYQQKKIKKLFSRDDNQDSATKSKLKERIGYSIIVAGEDGYNRELPAFPIFSISQ